MRRGELHTGLNLLKMKLEEFIVPLGNTFLELKDGDSQVKEGSFRKTVKLKEISFSVLQCGYLYCHYYK